MFFKSPFPFIRSERFPININIDFHLISFTPNKWKWQALKTLVRHAYGACSNDYYLGCELQQLQKVFHKQNIYSIWVINKIFKEIQSKQNVTTPITTGNEERNNNVENHLLILPYKGTGTMYIISSM